VECLIQTVVRDSLLPERACSSTLSEVSQSRIPVDIPEGDCEPEEYEFEYHERYRVRKRRHNQLNEFRWLNEPFIVIERLAGEKWPEQKLGTEGVAKIKPEGKVSEEMREMCKHERSGRLNSPDYESNRVYNDDDQRCKQQRMSDCSATWHHIESPGKRFINQIRKLRAYYHRNGWLRSRWPSESTASVQRIQYVCNTEMSPWPHCRRIVRLSRSYRGRTEQYVMFIAQRPEGSISAKRCVTRVIGLL